MHLATTRPTQPEPVWASIMTGMWPSRHGVRGSSRYRPFNGDAELEVLPDYVFSQALVRFGLLVEDPLFLRQPRDAAAVANRRWIRRAHRIGRPASDASRHRCQRLHHQRSLSSSSRSSRDARRRAGRVAEPVGRCRPRCAGGGTAGPRARVRLDLLPWTGESGSTVEADRLHHRLAQQLAAVEDVQSARPFATRGSMPSATTTCATRCPRRLAT